MISFALVPWDDPLHVLSVQRKAEELASIFCSDFVREHVIPVMRPEDAEHVSVSFGNGNAMAGAALSEFLSHRQEKTGKEPVIVLNWAGELLILNALLSNQAGSLQVKTVLIPAHPALQMFFHNENFFSRHGLKRHNALDDARAMRLSLMTYQNAFLMDPFEVTASVT